MPRSMSRPADPRRPAIRVTKKDRDTIGRLLASRANDLSWRSVEYLVRELMRATIVDDNEVPSDLVTIGSRVEYCEQGRGSTHVVTLCYPDELTRSADAISILTPAGAALLGLAAGQSICYAGPDGRPTTMTVVRVMPPFEARHQVRARRAVKPRSERPRTRS